MMPARPVTNVLIGVAVVVTSLAGVPGAAAGGTSATPEQRAAELVSQLTLDEKITQLHGIRDGNHLRFVPGVPRLNIPPLRITNGPAGVGPSDDPQQKPATALPAPMSLAATFDPGLAGTYGDVQGAETRALAHSLLEAPDINLTRVPQNGRTFETYGEDPFLAGADLGREHPRRTAERDHRRG